MMSVGAKGLISAESKNACILLRWMTWCCQWLHWRGMGERGSWDGRLHRAPCVDAAATSEVETDLHVTRY